MERPWVTWRRFRKGAFSEGPMVMPLGPVCVSRFCGSGRRADLEVVNVQLAARDDEGHVALFNVADARRAELALRPAVEQHLHEVALDAQGDGVRSEERRVGKECRSR